MEYQGIYGKITPLRVHTIVVSTQHNEGVTHEEIETQIKE
jgi:S-adenosylmethionine synthetase